MFYVTNVGNLLKIKIGRFGNFMPVPIIQNAGTQNRWRKNLPSLWRVIAKFVVLVWFSVEVVMALLFLVKIIPGATMFGKKFK